MMRYSCEGRIITVIQNKAIKHICLIYCVPRNSGIARASTGTPMVQKTMEIQMSLWKEVNQMAYKG